MSRYFNAKIVFGALATTIFSSFSYLIYKAYMRSNSPSNFELAASKLGFNGYSRTEGSQVTKIEQQEALLRCLHMAGCFSPDSLWQALNKMGGIADPTSVYKKIYETIVRSGANSAEIDGFDAKLLRKNLAKGTYLETQDVMDLLIYITQNTFGRSFAQERNELESHDWMIRYREQYFDSARKLGLIDREIPQYKEYDACFILGASTIGIMSRIIDLRNIISKYEVKIKNGIYALAGNREFWANIDGIETNILNELKCSYKEMSDIDLLEISLLVGENSEILENGKLYALYLAQLNEIKLNSDEPFIVYHRLSDCPNGRFPGRTYPNYQKGEDKKLTESLIAQDLLKNYPIYDGEGLKVEIIDSLSSPGGLRPTTASTARDATENLVMRILKGDFGETKKFKILAQTNQPYIERQTISTQTEATKVFEKHGLLLKGYEIEVEGVGFGCKQDVPTVSSEFAAMLSERWKKATASTDTHSSRSINQLQYQSRDNHYFEDPIPDNLVNEASGIIGIVQTFFDHYLV